MFPTILTRLLHIFSPLSTSDHFHLGISPSNERTSVDLDPQTITMSPNQREKDIKWFSMLAKE